MKSYLKIFNDPKKFFRAVCIGSSTTTQDWCHLSWIDWLNYSARETEDWENAWRKRFLNLGRDGANTDHFIKYFNKEVAFYKPHVVVFSCGLNYLKPRTDNDKIRSDLHKLFKKIKSINSDLIVWAPYAIPKREYIKELEVISKTIESATKEFNGRFIDIFNEYLKYDLKKLFTFKNNNNTYWGIEANEVDYLHCNLAGNQIIAEKIAKEGFNMELNDWEFGTMKLLDLEKYKI